MIEKCDICGDAAELMVARFGAVARRCPHHSHELRTIASENRDGSYFVLLDFTSADDWERA